MIPLPNRPAQAMKGSNRDLETDGAPLVFRLRGVNRDQRAAVGGKALNLAILMRGGLPVPPGFCVSTAAFHEFLASCPKRSLVTDLLAVPRAGFDRGANVSEQIAAALAKTPVSTRVEEAVLRIWREQGEDRAYAVRSSATAEDADHHSYAGQFASFLNVRGREALLSAIKECWLSLFSERALAYQANLRLSPDQAAMAVVVQVMVPAEAAGVLFTVDPVSGSASRMVIEGTKGLGDQLVSGRVRPECVVLEKARLRVIRRQAATGAPGLDEAMVRQLGKLARKAERLFQRPLDLEWAVAGGQVFLLQARPTTTMPRARSWEDRQVWTNLNTGEVLPDVTTPMTWSVLQLLLAPIYRSVFQLVGADSGRAPLLGLVAGRAYFNVNTALAALKPYWFVLRRIPNLAQALGGGQVSDYQQALADIPDEDLPDLGFAWPRFILSWTSILSTLISHSARRGDAWYARLKARTDSLAEMDVESMPTPELVQAFERLIRESFHGWDLLYLVTQAVALPVFQKACRDWLDDPDLALGYRLFAALGGIPETEAGLALWRLAALAHGERETENALLAGDDWLTARARLGQTGHGRQFMVAWQSFMAEHGHHGRGELELFNARWSEKPDYILGLLRGYLRAMDQASPLEKHRRLAQEREEQTEQCFRRLKNPVERWIFARSLSRAQKLAVNREAWKNQAVRQFAFLRRVLLKLGARFCTESILVQPEDVFFLDVCEIALVSGGRAGFDVKALIQARRKEYETNLASHPPPVVVGRFDPNTEPVSKAGESAKVLQGIPVYPGVVIGPARVILRADDHEQVLPGEILVAPFTDPAWTPYFVTAAGVVMDLGGILSHGSIVAREYGLPAVTNVGSATRIIRTGDLVQVDGSRGAVTLLSAKKGG
jgi:rifampicin phosphotransferase